MKIDVIHQKIEENLRQSAKTLDLSGSDITDLPFELSKLTHLRSLTINNSRVMRLDARVFSRLSKLTHFSATNCDLAAFPDGLRVAHSLREVDCSDNGIFAITPEIAQMSVLRTLDLHDNAIVRVASEIVTLDDLRYLDLSHNRIRTLPGEIGSFRERVVIKLTSNPLEDPLGKLAVRGASELFKYLRGTVEGEPLYEAKCILVGEGTVGKTSILEALRQRPFIENRPVTHGIAIKTFSTTMPDSPTGELVLRVWDFGGQRIYRVTHPFFYSRAAIYLVVWRPREGHDPQEVEQWIRSIIGRVGTDVSIIVVATHADEQAVSDLDEDTLRARYGPCLVAFHSVDSKSGRGIDDLKEIISTVATSIPTATQRWPRNWLAARNVLTEVTQPQISLEALTTLCKKEQIPAEDVPLFATVLNDCGLLIYFPDDNALSDQVVLNPEWLAKAIGAIFNDPKTIASGGIIKHRRIVSLWSSSDFTSPTALHPYLLRMMETFDISYRIPDQEMSLIAQMLPFRRPDPPWPATRAALRIVCELDDHAPGLIPWLIVRHHRFSVGKHWRNGVFLYEPRDESRVLLELTGRRLNLQVSGPYPALMFNVIRDSIEELLARRWPGIGYTLYVPCGNGECKGNFKLHALIEHAKRGLNEHHCDECFSPRPVNQLLLGYYGPTDILERLGNIEQEISQARSDLDIVKTFGSDLRLIKRVLSTEVIDCPRLFTIRPEDVRQWNRARFWESRWRLCLWCEEQQMEHPIEPAYVFTQPREWFRVALPYVKLVARTLSLAVPIAGDAIGVATGGLRGSRNSELELTKAILAVGNNLPESIGASEFSATSAEAASLRMFREFLFELDPHKEFAGLRQVTTAAGERLYVCEEHFKTYDPGLPAMG